MSYAVWRLRLAFCSSPTNGRANMNEDPLTPSEWSTWPPRLLARSPMIFNPRAGLTPAAADPLSETPHLAQAPARESSTRTSPSLPSKNAWRATLVTSSYTIIPNFQHLSEWSHKVSAASTSLISIRFNLDRLIDRQSV